MIKKSTFLQVAHRLGFFELDWGPHCVAISVDKEGPIRRAFVPDLREKLGRMYAYGQIAIFLGNQTVKGGLAMMPRDVQNISSLRISHADVTTIELAENYLISVKDYLADLPANLADLHDKAGDKSHWIGKQMTWDFEVTRHFRKILETFDADNIP